MAENQKLQAQLEIKSIQPSSAASQPRTSTDFTAEELVKEQQRIPFPFFRPLSRRKENTWVISVFFILHFIAFAATMFVNDCWGNSHGQCEFKQLGKFSFQPIAENPLLGPSASALDAMGALRQRYLIKDNQYWRLFASPCLHAGVFHIIINLSSVVFVGVHMEQEFGSLRIGIIYILSALTGSSVAALFLQDRPSVASSGALFGLLGATLSGLIWNWKVYTRKMATLVAFFIILVMNTILGLMPYVNNFSNVGGFISGILIGFVILFKPQAGQIYQAKGGIFDYDIKHSVKLKQKLDKPVVRSVSLLLFMLLFIGVGVAILQSINMNKYCSWCHYINCVPFKWWSCNNKSMNCETMISLEKMTMTCSSTGNYKVFPFTNVTQARLEDLCNLVCL
ncbi:RHOMBOID-like protein 8 [Andrographis paniculata]|uniref:RHOMBOID-like protein 8 n=1 Tax=Andrographis paniculata TaxID=175694 RepID=UPI0021E81F73|nr:RHOMBOID-like protein 8 [Andrographis paniculata]